MVFLESFNTQILVVEHVEGFLLSSNSRGCSRWRGEGRMPFPESSGSSLSA